MNECNEYHVSVLYEECLKGLRLKKDGIYMDGTHGGGGHSKGVLEAIGDKGRLLAFDKDMEAMNNIPQDKRVIPVCADYKYMKNFCHALGIEKLDGIVADLGVSSHQFDSKERGFSYKHDAPIDMRMNRRSERTASDILNTYGQKALEDIFRLYGEVKEYKKLANKIVEKRQKQHIDTTGQLRSIVEEGRPAHKVMQQMSKIFQALRIEINKELESLKMLLLDSVDMLKTSGRLAIISYHSLEDRLVKNMMNTGNLEGERLTDIKGHVQKPFMSVCKLITPSEEEIKANRRSRSAKLRIMERI